VGRRFDPDRAHRAEFEKPFIDKFWRNVTLVKSSMSRFEPIVLIATPTITTLVISPFSSYDPINLPKMLVLVTGASLLLVPLLARLRSLVGINSLFISVALAFIVTLMIAFFRNPAPYAQQLWGVWGRSTGLLTYIAFVVVLLSTILFSFRSEGGTFRQVFERLSYFITAYTLIQAGDIDPINWSQKAMVATLGNINFMSSFLGLASISFFSRLLIEKLPITSKVHYSILILINLFLIWLSESIQGVAVFAAGASIILAFTVRRNLDFKRVIYWFLSIIPVGSISFLGVAGLGPLSMLRQETVIFRRDYWLAGIAMTKENWLDGVGIDSYGDYYEQYRDLEAVVRTGPQRITNTAHNIFLDVSSGAGVLAGIAFFAMFTLTIATIIRILKRGEFDPSLAAFSGMFVGFLIFSLISINQIGVGVWGFVFMGYVIGAGARQELLSNNSLSKKDPGKQRSKKLPYEGRKIENSQVSRALLFLVTLLVGTLGFFSALIPFRNDMNMLAAVRAKDFESMKIVALRDSATTFHREKYMTLLVDAGRDLEAYEFALTEYERNSRSKIALRVIAYSEQALKELRISSLERLIEQDPYNSELVTNARNLSNELRSR
jgi:O-antigen ligase